MAYGSIANPIEITEEMLERAEAKMARARPAPKAKPEFIPQFGPVVSDAEFIRLTRSRTYDQNTPGQHENRSAASVHDPEIAALFWSNGGWERDEITGKRFYQKYDTLAQAFDALRAHKLAKLAGITPSEYVRHHRLGNDARVFVPGFKVNR